MFVKLGVAIISVFATAGFAYPGVQLAEIEQQQALLEKALFAEQRAFDNSFNLDGRLNDTHYVFDTIYTDRGCNNVKAGAIFSTETCRHNLYDFTCKRSEVVQNIYNPTRDRGCKSEPLFSHTFDNGCRRGVSFNENDYHFRFQCGVPDSALILVPDCGDVYGFTYASFLPTRACLGKVSWECDGKGNTIARIYQQDGCKGRSVTQQLAKAGDCVEGFSLFCHERSD